ncbi:MAG TPA: hypothetical protein VIL19_09895 [Casimicrobiaceae bacterium]
MAKDADEARRWYTAAIANPKTDKGALAAKAQARTRLASLVGATQEVFPYNGGRFVLVRADSGACVVALQGPITYETSFKFDEVVERSNKLGCVKPTLMLESPGGLVSDGIKMGEEVREQGFQTVTRYECASACAFIFLGAWSARWWARARRSACTSRKPLTRARTKCAARASCRRVPSWRSGATTRT